jgi:hypothetical protein
MALAAALIFRRAASHSKGTILRYAVIPILCGLIMVCGYFLYETALFGAPYAIVGVPFNLAQAASNGIVFAAVSAAIRGRKK